MNRPTGKKGLTPVFSGVGGVRAAGGMPFLRLCPGLVPPVPVRSAVPVPWAQTPERVRLLLPAPPWARSLGGLDRLLLPASWGAALAVGSGCCRKNGASGSEARGALCFDPVIYIAVLYHRISAFVRDYDVVKDQNPDPV